MNRKKEFEKFYQNNIDKIYRFVFFRVGKEQTLAEDLVSEIFMKALEHFDSYDREVSTSAWLFTIAKNHLANYWRDRKDVESLPEVFEDVENDDDSGSLEGVLFNSSMENFKESEKNGQIYSILDQLPSDDKQIVTFHYLYGYSYLEIAEMLGKSETSVKTAAHRAIKKLKELL